MKLTITPSDALIVVDMQNDFMPGGALPVPEAETLVPLLNRLLVCFSTRVLTRDWHPANHISFSPSPAFKDLSWPPHGVQNTAGAAFHPGLHVQLADRIASKADQPDQEAYSGFQGTDLSVWLQGRSIRRVFISGVATDYCVKSTAWDAVRAGFQTVLIQDAVRAVAPDTGQAALAAMRGVGILFAQSADLQCP